MAWILEREGSTEKYKLLANRDYVIGRKEADIILSNDPAISRKHAVITISHHESNVNNINKIPTVVLKDFSKYGTKLNGNNVVSNGSLLSNNDKILFGILQNDWRIGYKPFVCCSSDLSKETKCLVRSQLAKIGGHLVADWTLQCNYLVMDKITITMKVINALVSQHYVVTTKFLPDLIDSVEKKCEEPDPRSYIPPVMEPLLRDADVSFLPNDQRRTILIKKTFYVFSPKQMKKLEFAVKSSGGAIVLLNKDLAKLSQILSDERSCIIRPSVSEEQEEFFITMSCKMDRLGIRFIAEAEIGLAILHCNTVAFCNSRGSGDNEYLLGSLHSSCKSLTDQSVRSNQGTQFELEATQSRSQLAEDGADNVEQHESKANLFLTAKSSRVRQDDVKNLECGGQHVKADSDVEESQLQDESQAENNVVVKEQLPHCIKLVTLDSNKEQRATDCSKSRISKTSNETSPSSRKLHLRGFQYNSALPTIRSKPLTSSVDNIEVIDLVDDDEIDGQDEGRCSSPDLFGSDTPVAQRTLLSQADIVIKKEVEDFNSDIKREDVSESSGVSSEDDSRKLRDVIGYCNSRKTRSNNMLLTDLPPAKKLRSDTLLLAAKRRNSSSEDDVQSSKKLRSSSTEPSLMSSHDVAASSSGLQNSSFGYLTARNHDVKDSTNSDNESKPSEESFVNVLLLSLVKIRIEDELNAYVCNNPKKNFKKFKKVLPKYAANRSDSVKSEMTESSMQDPLSTSILSY